MKRLESYAVINLLTPSGKASKGTVEVIQSHGWLQLRFRYGGKWFESYGHGQMDKPSPELKQKRAGTLTFTGTRARAQEVKRFRLDGARSRVLF
jgi:hypothetical protein